MNATDLQKVIDWLIDGAGSATSSAQKMAESCERLVDAGLPLWRVSVFVRTLHPDMIGRTIVWRPGADVVITPVDFDIVDTPNSGPAR